MYPQNASILVRRCRRLSRIQTRVPAEALIIFAQRALGERDYGYQKYSLTEVFYFIEDCAAFVHLKLATSLDGVIQRTRFSLITMESCVGNNEHGMSMMDF